MTLLHLLLLLCKKKKFVLGGKKVRVNPDATLPDFLMTAVRVPPTAC